MVSFNEVGVVKVRTAMVRVISVSQFVTQLTKEM